MGNKLSQPAFTKRINPSNMNKLYLTGIFILLIATASLLPNNSFSQACNTINAKYAVTESVCAASGIIEISAGGGSGSYEYRVAGPVSTAFTTNNVVSGLPAGVYNVIIKDVVLNCIYDVDSVTVVGTYVDPVFKLVATNASCVGVPDGTITATSVKFGRPPFSFQIVAPSTSGIGTVSTAGVFTGLISGTYFIQLTDSCGTTVLRKIDILSTGTNCCAFLAASYTTSESRCEATGTVQINAIGGSGTYQYKASGPITTAYTSSSLISGLPPGRYLIIVKDVVTNCEYNKDSITIDGDYTAPNFIMAATDVTCINGKDGTITVTGQQYGRAPFSYQIIAPSASGVGTVSVPGIFTGLTSGNYFIQLRDSCGAIQTRNVTIQNYNWFIDSYTGVKFDCDSVLFTIKLKDSRGNVTPNAIFNGFLYGASIIPGDTTWFTTNTFKYYVGNNNVVKLFVKDLCGNIKSVVWTGPSVVPSVSPVIAMSNMACLTFTATVTGQINLTAPQYCIYNNIGTLVTCNTTGIFNLLPYGAYTITIQNSCYDTTITRVFTAVKPLPSVDLNVQVSCNDFTITVTGQQNRINNNMGCKYSAAFVCRNE